MTKEVKILLDHPDARMPAYAHPGDAGADLRAVLPAGEESVVIDPGERALISTGLKMDIPIGFEVQIRPRSGLALKHGVTVLNTPGTIDSQYRGIVGVILINHGSQPFTIEPGDRIAQMVVARLPGLGLAETDRINETDRGAGGFGSTGVS